MPADTHARTGARTHTPRYTSLLKHSFMLLACRGLAGEPGRSFLREDLAMVCYEHEHLIWALGVALPAILLWVVGFPIAKVLALYTRRHKLEDEHTHATYGFLYNGFQPGFYWWEFVVDARKILMAAISVFIGDERIYVKTILVVLLCLVSFALQVTQIEIGPQQGVTAWRVQSRCEPSSSDELNKLDELSLLTLAITFLLGSCRSV